MPGKKAFWKKAVFFTAEGGRLNKAHVQHLESRLIALAHEAGLVELDNGNQPTTPALSEEEYASAENFLREILLMLPLLRFWQFADDRQEEVEAEIQEEVQEVPIFIHLYPDACVFTFMAVLICKPFWNWLMAV
jgi:hypothetical protein